MPLCQSGKRCLQADPGTLKLISIACHLPAKSDIFCCLILSVGLLTQANQSEGLSSRQDGTRLCCLQDLDFPGATFTTVMQNTFQKWHSYHTGRLNSSQGHHFMLQVFSWSQPQKTEFRLLQQPCQQLSSQTSSSKCPKFLAICHANCEGPCCPPAGSSAARCIRPPPA